MVLLTSSKMSLYLVIISIGLYASIITGYQTDLNMCMQSESVAVQISTGTTDDDLSCQCQASRARDSTGRRDYTHTPGIGSHKLHVEGQTWNEARKICKEESAHLAIINSRAEEEVLLKMLKTSASNINHADGTNQGFIGAHDLFQEGEWLTIFGESLESTGYARWTEAYLPYVQPDNAGGNQNCGSLVASGGLDDEVCSKKYAFFCELPLSCL